MTNRCECSCPKHPQKEPLRHHKELARARASIGPAAVAAFVLLAAPLAASADPTYLRCDFKNHQGSSPSEGAIDLTLNEAKGTVETRVLGFDGYTDNGYFGPKIIEFDAVETGIPMVLDRTTRWVVAKGQNNVRICVPINVPAVKKF